MQSHTSGEFNPGRSAELDRAIRLNYRAGSLTPMILRFSNVNGDLIFKYWAYAIELRFTSGDLFTTIDITEREEASFASHIADYGIYASQLAPPPARVAGPDRPLWPSLTGVPLLPQRIH
jgi:hypothetical protein